MKYHYNALENTVAIEQSITVVRNVYDLEQATKITDALDRAASEGLITKQVEYHRNGVGGESFYVVRFEFISDDSRESDDCLAVVFPYDTYESPRCAVFDFPKLAQGKIGGASSAGLDDRQWNAKRGDYYAGYLRPIILAVMGEE